MSGAELNNTFRPRRRANLEERAVVGETVVLDASSNTVHYLNATATFIWAFCDGRSSLGEIANEVATAYDLEVGAAETDVRSTLNSMLQAGLLEP